MGRGILFGTTRGFLLGLAGGIQFIIYSNDSDDCVLKMNSYINHLLLEVSNKNILDKIPNKTEEMQLNLLKL